MLEKKVKDIIFNRFKYNHTNFEKFNMLQHIELILDIEKEFDIVIDDQESESLLSIVSLIDHIKYKLSNKL